MSSLLPQLLKVPKKIVVDSVVVTEKKEPISRFWKPSITEIQDFMKEKEFQMYKSEGERFFNWFESNGWKVGKNPMKSWKGAINTWIANYYERNKMTVKKSKIDTVKEAHENLDEVDWNQVYSN